MKIIAKCKEFEHTYPYVRMYTYIHTYTQLYNVRTYMFWRVMKQCVFTWQRLRNILLWICLSTS